MSRQEREGQRTGELAQNSVREVEDPGMPRDERRCDLRKRGAGEALDARESARWQERDGERRRHRHLTPRKSPCGRVTNVESYRVSKLFNSDQFTGTLDKPRLQNCGTERRRLR